MDDKISIIVPVYNVEKYLNRCLDSISRQTYIFFEVICVDDGSTDCSGLILDEYEKKDNRFIVFHTVNRGVSHARNYALERISGDWFAFIDADDWVEEDYLYTLLDNAKNNKCEISACDYVLEKKDKKTSLVHENKIVCYNTPQQCIIGFICGRPSLRGMVWNKLYRTVKYKDIVFHSDYVVNEDCLYTYEVMERCEKACVTDKTLYHWFIREDSECHRKREKANFQEANVFLELLERMEWIKSEKAVLFLKRNYVNTVTKIIWNMKHDNSPEVNEARMRIRLWRRETWKLLNTSSRIKYIIILYFSWILQIKDICR